MVAIQDTSFSDIRHIRRPARLAWPVLPTLPSLSSLPRLPIPRQARMVIALGGLSPALALRQDMRSQRQPGIYRLRLGDGTQFALRARQPADLCGDANILFENCVQDVYGMKALVKRGQTILDLGAHIGTFAVRAARLAGPEGRVIAVEPMPDTFALLQQNCRLNRLGNVQLVNAAVDDTAGAMTLNIADDNTGGHSKSKRDGLERSIIVAATTFQDIFDQHKLDRVDVMKLDCEGGEYAVLQDRNRELIRSIGEIRGELHEDRQASHSRTRATEDRLAWLEQQGFQVTIQGEPTYCLRTGTKLTLFRASNRRKTGSLSPA